MRATLSQMFGGRADRQQLVRFLLVGSSNTAVSFAVYVVLLAVLAAGEYSAALAQLGSYSAGMVWSFVLNRDWVFKKSRKDHKTALRFIAVQLSLMVLSTALIAGLARSFGSHPVLIWAVVMSFVTVCNYALLRHWAFKIL